MVRSLFQQSFRKVLFYNNKNNVSEKLTRRAFNDDVWCKSVYRMVTTVKFPRKNSRFHQRRQFSNPSDEQQTTQEYLTSLGYDDPDVQEGMKDALKAAFGNNVTVANLKSLGTEGLAALSKSVIDQLKQNNATNRSICTVHVKIPHHKFNFDLKTKEGDNFMAIATQGAGRELLGEYLECACGGNMSCATCHVILDPISFSKLDPPCEAECDMLDLAFEPTDTSRLGCQVVMSKEIDGMTITIPAGVNNFWS